MDQTTICLSAQEEKLFNELLTVFPKALETEDFELYVAGGWVRDKILSLPSNDIDILIQSPFPDCAHLEAQFEKMFKTHGQMGIQGLKLWKGNPAKGKQNDVLMIKICDIALEFVALKKAEDTGVDSLLHDASQRDLTINSMFYDIKHKSIRDPLGLGIPDLKNKVLRTSASPDQTFARDPVRVLRVARFFARYESFTIDPTLQEYVVLPTTASLVRPLSRERIGLEIEKMIEGDRPDLAFTYLAEWGLYPEIFPIKDDTRAWDQKIASECCSSFCAMVEMLESGLSGSLKRAVLLAALLLPFSVPPSMPFTRWQFTQELKMDTPTITNIFLFLESWKEMKQYNTHRDKSQILEVGRLLRALNGNWQHVWKLSFIEALLEGATEKHKMEQQLAEFIEYLEGFQFLGPNPIWKIKPLVNGSELSKQFGLTKADIGAGLNTVIEWQMSNPNGNKQECFQFLQNKYQGQ